jgi:hypothetical protein
VFCRLQIENIASFGSGIAAEILMRNLGDIIVLLLVWKNYENIKKYCCRRTIEEILYRYKLFF